MPFLDATPIAVKYESGTDIAIAHGHDITKNVKPLYIPSVLVIFIIIGPNIAIAIASNNTTGV